MSDGTRTDTRERRLLALEFLTRAADDLERATITRIRYIGLARKHGNTWRDIATALGLTETGARTLYNRNSDLVYREMQGDLAHVYDGGDA